MKENGEKSPYQEGVEARRRGEGWFSCPYTDARRMYEWFDGWDSEPYPFFKIVGG